MSFSIADLRESLSFITSWLADPAGQALAAALLTLLGALLGVRLAERWQARRNLRDLRLAAYVRFLGSFSQVKLSKASGGEPSAEERELYASRTAILLVGPEAVDIAAERCMANYNDYRDSASGAQAEKKVSGTNPVLLWKLENEMRRALGVKTVKEEHLGPPQM